MIRKIDKSRLTYYEFPHGNDHRPRLIVVVSSTDAMTTNRYRQGTRYKFQVCIFVSRSILVHWKYSVDMKEISNQATPNQSQRCFCVSITREMLVGRTPR